tara:strand:- start:3506 stop:3712 length:207 start_codon:yes stop_codon:yes gene_type:complete
MKKFITVIIAILASFFIQAQSISFKKITKSFQLLELSKANYCNKSTLEKMPRKKRASRSGKRNRKVRK